MSAERGKKGVDPMPEFGRGDRVLVRPLTPGVRHAIGGQFWGEIISVYTEWPMEGAFIVRLDGHEERDTLGCGPDAVLEWELRA